MTEFSLTEFSLTDYAALLFFVGAWLCYHLAVELTAAGRRSLNATMDEYRQIWMEQFVVRGNQTLDGTIIASLQNGTAFFASTSLIAIGGVLALLQSTERVLSLFADLPFGLATARVAWEVKVIGLAIIFVYAFFKFAWAYRLFAYVAILIGAVPVLTGDNEAKAQAAGHQAAAMHIVAGKHFNRGQRAFFFALAYLGWFVGPIPFMAFTAAVLYVMWRRQFVSDALATLSDEGRGSVMAARPSESAIEQALLALLDRREIGQTIDPVEVARAVAGDHPDAWGPQMPAIRRVAVRLMKQGRLVILRKGRPVDPDDFRGVYRLAAPPGTGLVESSAR